MLKVAVIGGGPAGLTAAIEGARQGLTVTLYEKGAIGDKISCAEGFFDTLNILGQPKYGVKYKVEAVVVQMNSTYTFPCDPQMNIWMLDKAEWQKGLAEEARGLGVDIRENSPVTPELLQQLKADYDWVLDSSGPFSVTARVYGFNGAHLNTSALCAQYVLSGDFTHLAGQLKIGLEDGLPGYYWIFPKGSGQANVGICCFKKHTDSLWCELDRFLEREGIGSYQKLKRNGGLCPVKKLDQLVYDNIILTGDAAGLVSPLHAAGIDTACISGKLAVQSIVEGKVKSYAKLVDRVLLKKIKADRMLYQLWQALGFKHLENATEIVVTNPDIQLVYSDLFNGNFNLRRNLKYLKHIKYLKDFIKKGFWQSSGNNGGETVSH